MSSTKHHLNCPGCGQDIDVQQVLVTQIESKLAEDYAAKAKAQKAAEKKALEALAQERAALEEARLQQTQLVEQTIETRLKQREAELERSLKAKTDAENKKAMESLNQELQEKTLALAGANQLKVELERLKRDSVTLRDTVELEAEKKLNEQLHKERLAMEQRVEDKAGLEVLELKQQLDTLKTQLQAAHKKAHQGSMQVQGEAQELAIEGWLKDKFPQDEIEEIKKGAKGADCLQVINTPNRANCGRILYESKRTKNFSPSWIEKFKEDIRDKQADIGVLVTEVMPKDMKHFGLKDGIYVCTFQEFKALSQVLRHSLIELSRVAQLEENKGDIKTMLFQYCTSSEFKGHIEAIIEGFNQMQQDLDKEKRAMQGLWKKREKQLTKVLENTTFLYSSVKGIGGSRVGEVEALQFGVQDQEPVRVLTFESGR